MKKILLVFGTRPEAIKMAPLVNQFKKNENFEVKVCVTGQHREMLNSVLEVFNIVPNFNLDIFKHGQSIVEIQTKTMNRLDELFKNEKFDMVLVHGDTIATSSTAQVAFLNKIPVGHIEAGLRSYNINSPFPEEANRKITGVLSTMHFAPTEGNKQNLIKEGIKENIFVTGNTVIDALKDVIDDNYIFENNFLKNYDFKNNKTILLTCHRRENWGEPMENIFNGINEVVKKNDKVNVIYPIHLNPLIREVAKKILGSNDRIQIIEPLDYEPFANLINKIDIIVTDSGGIQEEAPALGKPVLVVRMETERPEAVEAGTVKVIGVNKEDIVEQCNLLLLDENQYKKMSKAANPYGTGDACSKIIDCIAKYLK